MGDLLDCVKWSTDYLMKLHAAIDEMYVCPPFLPPSLFLFIYHSSNPSSLPPSLPPIGTSKSATSPPTTSSLSAPKT